ncbi:MAG: hypothetical protein H7831_01230 [Magnetococcus sp. WYHC-3]
MSAASRTLSWVCAGVCLAALPAQAMEYTYSQVTTMDASQYSMGYPGMGYPGQCNYPPPLPRNGVWVHTPLPDVRIFPGSTTVISQPVYGMGPSWREPPPPPVVVIMPPPPPRHPPHPTFLAHPQY